MRALIITPVLLLSAPALAFGPPTAEQREARFEQAMDEIDATSQQRTTIRSFIEETVPALQDFHEEGDVLRTEMRTVFLAPTVDRSAVELLRVDTLDLMDRASSVVLDLFVDVANVLSVDQRATLHELHDRHHQRFARGAGLTQ